MYFFIITLFSLNICTISALVSRVVHLPVYLASCQPMMRAPALCCRSCPMPKPLVLPASGNFNFYRVYYTQCFFLSFLWSSFIPFPPFSPPPFIIIIVQNFFCSYILFAGSGNFEELYKYYYFTLFVKFLECEIVYQLPQKSENH